jgi:hypothetical protein
MPDEQPNEQMREWDTMEREAVYLLTDPERLPPIWSVQDMGRELETSDPMAVIRPLCCAGLLNRTCDGFVFATPAAFKMVGLVGHVV